jgi:lysophospholipase L1-like esterase
MKPCLTRILAGIVALTTLSLLGCSSNGSAPGTGSAGSTGTPVTTSGGASAGGTTTSPPGSGGVITSGGTTEVGGQSQASSASQGGSAAGGGVTSAAGQPTSGSSGGSVTGGRASGGASGGESATGGRVAGGSVAGGSVVGGSSGGGSVAGGSVTGGSVAGGSSMGGSIVGGSVAGGSVAGGSAMGGRGGSAAGSTATGGRATGGATGGIGGVATGGKTTTGGTAAGGTPTGGTTTPPVGGSLGSSDGTTPITVWMSGDSTMAGDKCAGGGWGDQFGSLFNKNVTVVNKSVAGRSIQTWLYEGNVSSTAGANGECTLTGTTYSANWNAMLTGMKTGDWLFIEFGINDGDATCPRHVGTTLFQTYLTTMAKAASDRGAQAIFLTSTSAIECNGATAQADRGFGPQTKAAGTADNVPVIDMTVLTANLYTSLGLCPNAGDYTSTTSKLGLFFCNDHTHFEAAGGLQIAQTAAKALKDQGIGLAAYLLN